MSLDIVECDSGEAKYEVVAFSDVGHAQVCDGHPDGEVYKNTGKKRKVYWSICAVPK